MMLTGQVALVTGAGRGIGRAVAEALLDQGAHVMGCGRGARPEDLPETINWTVCDVSDSARVEELFSETARQIGPVSILVNNAGVQIEKTLADSSDQDWDQVIGTNCRGVFNCCRAAISRAPEQGLRIVNIGSISGNVADSGMALYNASKAFVHGLTRSIAADHGPRVRCNAIAPGWIMTDMADAAFAVADDPVKAQADALARHPAGRFGQPGAIAGMVVWLVSDQAEFVTGQVFTVDGGLTAVSPLRPELG